MKLSTRGRYGARVMLDLAQHYGEGPILLRDISLRQRISEKYLWQLMAPLKQAALVQATRGINGGYQLARSPHDISLKEVISVLEGPIRLVECTGSVQNCEAAAECVTREIWHDISVKIGKMLESISLAEMVERQKNKISSLNYSI